MATIDWSGRELRTKSGKIGVLLDPVPHETRRRVQIARHGLAPIPDDQRPGHEKTTWLYPESGVARTDGKPSDMDLVA